MKNKKGFTLVELLAVVVLIAIITLLGFAGVGAARENIKKNIWEGTVSSIEAGAKLWGEDNQIRLLSSCNVKIYDPDGKYLRTETQQRCVMITVDQLIKFGYLRSNKTKECPAGSYKKEAKIVVDDRLSEEEAGYIINNRYVYVYVENQIVYAQISDEQVSGYNICANN